MSLVGSLLAVFVGATLVAGDIERRVLYPVIAKPVSRTEYLLGRYAGLALLLLVNLGVMAAVLALVLVAEARRARAARRLAPRGVRDARRPVPRRRGGRDPLLVDHLEHARRDPRASPSSWPGTSRTRCGALWQDEGVVWLAKAIWYVVPNLGALSLNEAVIYRTPVTADAWAAALYAILYAAAALALASLGFERRDMK